MKYKDAVVYLLILQFAFFVLSVIFNKDTFYIINFLINIICMVLAVISLIIKEK